MSRRGRQPWRLVTEAEVSKFLPLAEMFAADLYGKFGDLWPFVEVLFRLAVLKDCTRHDRIRIAYHYIWKAPSRSEIRRRHPEWQDWLVEARYQDFQAHIRQWGPGDVELVAVDLQRFPTPDAIDITSLNPSQFRPVLINYRTGAHVTGVINQIIHFEWDKVGNKRITVSVSQKEWEMIGRQLSLYVDSYHHSFHSPEEMSDPVLLGKLLKRRPIRPKLRHFSNSLWRYYQVVEKNRGYEPWEVENTV
ncbi:MAG: hypothetical protein WC528_04255 [Patescibacteria group bacterium]